jgi:hypothetical protein
MPDSALAFHYFALRGQTMKTLIAVLLASIACTSVYAADDCEAKAAEKKLAGAAKTSFMKKCMADASGSGSACEVTADQKKLAGAAKTSFVKKCEADAKGNQAGATCEAAAKEKKLAGAAKSSFVKKCVADAAAAN